MISGPVTIIAHFDACELIETDLIIGPVEVFEGEIAQYSFSNQTQNEAEWSIVGGEILWTSGFDNTIAVQWDYGITEGEIIIAVSNEDGGIDCYTTTISIEDSPLGQVGVLNKFVQVFPNPFLENLHIAHNLSGPLSILVFDQLGRVVFSDEAGLSINGEGLHRLTLPNLDSGIYFVMIKGEGAESVHTIKKM